MGDEMIDVAIAYVKPLFLVGSEHLDEIDLHVSHESPEDCLIVASSYL
jgi:hypothetical protein